MAALIYVSKYDFKGYRKPYFFKKTELQRKRLMNKLNRHDLFPIEFKKFCEINGLSICGITLMKKSDKIEVRAKNLNGDAILFRITGKGTVYKNLTNQGSWKKALIWNS